MEKEKGTLSGKENGRVVTISWARMDKDLLALVFRFSMPYSFVSQFVSKYWRQTWTHAVAEPAKREKRRLGRITKNMNASLELTKWAHETVKEKIGRTGVTEISVERAILSGDIQLAKWSFPKAKTHFRYMTQYSNLANEAAKAGNIEVLKLIKQCGNFWDADTIAYAARHGHLETVRWLRDQGCPWETGV